MTHLDGAVLHAVNHAERWQQLAARMHRDFELAARHGFNSLGEYLGTAINGVK